MWRVDIDIDPSVAFLQQGGPGGGVIYWLAVRVETTEGEFGWKTRDWPEHFWDDAVFDYGSELPRFWSELRYPPGHPYHGLEDDSIDLAFALTTEPTSEMEPKWSQPPHGPQEGFDAASDLWIVEMAPKWEQPPDPQWPGLHAHDWFYNPSRQIVTLADDWICGGGDVCPGKLVGQL